MHRSIFFTFACIDLQFCREDPDPCHIKNHCLAQLHMRYSFCFSFACIDLKYCIQPPDHCCIINHGLDHNYKVSNRTCTDLSFWFSIYQLETSYTGSFLFRPQFRRLGYAVSALKYVETARLLYHYYHNYHNYYCCCCCCCCCCCYYHCYSITIIIIITVISIFILRH